MSLFQSVTRHSLNPGGPGGTVFVFLTFLSTKLLLLQPQLAQITGAGLSMGVGQQAAHEQSTIARSAVVTILIACMSWRSPVKCLCEDEKSDFKRSLKCCVLFDTRKISKHQYTAAFHRRHNKNGRCIQNGRCARNCGACRCLGCFPENFRKISRMHLCPLHCAFC